MGYCDAKIRLSLETDTVALRMSSLMHLVQYRLQYKRRGVVGRRDVDRRGVLFLAGIRESGFIAHRCGSGQLRWASGNLLGIALTEAKDQGGCPVDRNVVLATEVPGIINCRTQKYSLINAKYATSDKLSGHDYEENTGLSYVGYES